MIEFYGELSDDCKRFILKEQYKVNLLSAILTCLCISTPLIISVVIWNYLAMYFLPFVGIVVIFCTFIAIPRINPQEKNVRASIPIRITIQEKTIERFGVGSHSHSIKNIDDIKNVIDMGAWYVIKFYFPNKDGYFFCEKDLIAEGSIKEFEDLFSDKLVKKIKEKS